VLSRIRKFASCDRAMDFGTANTIVHVPSRGAILNEPSDVGIETICGVKRVKAVETTILLPSACPI